MTYTGFSLSTAITDRVASQSAVDRLQESILVSTRVAEATLLSTRAAAILPLLEQAMFSSHLASTAIEAMRTTLMTVDTARDEMNRRYLSVHEGERALISALDRQVQLSHLATSSFYTVVDGTAAQIDAAWHSLSRLGELDWTFPADEGWNMRDLLALTRSATGKDADEFMLNWYEKNDPTLAAMESRLICDRRVKEHHAALRQCFRCIRAKFYAVAQFSLYPILENVLRQFASPEHQRSTSMIRIFRPRRRMDEDFYTDYIQQSLAAFVVRRYEHYVFDDYSEPVQGQRHAHLHGFKAPPNELVECLRLLQAIETALELLADRENTITLKLQN